MERVHQKTASRYTPILVALLLLAACGCQRETPAGASSPVAIQSPALPQLDLIELTTGGATADQRLPLIVAVHGLGDRPRNFSTVMAALDVPARVAVPQAPERYGWGFAWFPFRLAESSDEVMSRGISGAAERVAALIGRLERERPTAGRPIVTGFSQGGMISFAVALHHPETVGLAVPIGGCLPPPLRPAEKRADRKYPPIRALHGDADDLVPIGPTRKAVDELVSKGFDVALTSYPGVSHEVTQQMERDLHRLIAEHVKSL
jgi:phospholipase/carboxylesterase